MSCRIPERRGCGGRGGKQTTDLARCGVRGPLKDARSPRRMRPISPKVEGVSTSIYHEKIACDVISNDPNENIARSVGAHHNSRSVRSDVSRQDRPGIVADATRIVTRTTTIPHCTKTCNSTTRGASGSAERYRAGRGCSVSSPYRECGGCHGSRVIVRKRLLISLIFFDLDLAANIGELPF